MFPEMPILEIKRTTIADYEVMVEAYQLAQIDREFEIHMLAWQSVQAGASDKKGKPIYSSFKKFFNYEKRIKEVRSDEEIDGNTSSFFNRLKKINQGGD